MGGEGVSGDIMRTNPPINAMDFGVPPLFAERAENYARWAVAAEREVCAQILDRNAAACANNSMLRDVLEGNAAAIRARSQA